MSAETITTTELYASEAYKRNKLIYPHPQDLLVPFIDRVESQLNGIPIHQTSIKVDKESGAGQQNGVDLKTYGRGLITLEFGATQTGLRSTIGLLWAYDIGKAFVKVFFGASATACMNLCIFGADNIAEKTFTYPRVRDDKAKEREWKVSCDGIISHILYMTEDLMEVHLEKFAHIVELVQTLQSTDVHYDDTYEFMGKLYMEEIIKGNFDYSTFNEANRLMFDPKYVHKNKELYAVNREEQEDMNMWKLYGALTQRITDGNVDINSVADKTLEISEMIDKYVEV